ncbi:ankyrin repeat protein [Salinibacter ruber]|uniref:ankyrin repeat domain-containing protein n=1 Tax=Salinibacter ruber TaxID=146919 RepID=UPI0021695B3D|nr:ankyrin repeat protein [Salinibacter ruber]
MDWADQIGLTPLIAAARAGATDVVERLLEQGAGPMEATEQGRTPLHGAARSGSVESIDLLLEVGADPTRADSEGKAPIHEAARSGSVEAARRLVEAGADPTRDTWTKGEDSGETRLTPVYSAVKYVPPLGGDPAETLRFFIEQGAGINCTDPLERSPIYFCKGPEVAELLIDAGIEVNHFDRNGWSPLHKSAQERDAAVAQLLLDAGADPDISADADDAPAPLHHAAVSGAAEVAEALIAAGADVDKTSTKGIRPLHTAAERGDPAFAKVLLDAGADPTATDEEGDTPIDRAEEGAYGDQETVIKMIQEQK